QLFANLLDLHAMTKAWLKELNLDQPPTPHHLKRVLSPGIRDSFWKLETVSRSAVPREIEMILGEGNPDDVLSKLGYTVRAIQAWTLRSILEQTPSEEASALKNLLEHTSWKAGRECGSRRWQRTAEEPRQDLRGILAALQDSPLSGYPRNSTFLVIRALPQNARVELLDCPHQSRYVEVQPVVDELCALQTFWMRGFAYSLNSRVLIDYRPVTSEEREKRCTLHWHFHSAGPSY